MAGGPGLYRLVPTGGEGRDRGLTLPEASLNPRGLRMARILPLLGLLTAAVALTGCYAPGYHDAPDYGGWAAWGAWWGAMAGFWAVFAVLFFLLLVAAVAVVAALVVLALTGRGVTSKVGGTLLLVVAVFLALASFPSPPGLALALGLGLLGALALKSPATAQAATRTVVLGEREH